MYIALHPVRSCEPDRQVFWSASSLHYGWTATILRHCAGLPVRWAAFAVKMWVNCASVRWRWLWGNGPKKGWLAKPYIRWHPKERKLFQSLRTTWGALCNTGNVVHVKGVSFRQRPMGSKLYAQCSSRILKINKSRCHPRKVLDGPGVYCEKEKMDLQKKRPEVFQKNTFTLMKAGYGLMM